MTYNVFGGTLNLTQLINLAVPLVAEHAPSLQRTTAPNDCCFRATYKFAYYDVYIVAVDNITLH